MIVKNKQDIIRPHCRLFKKKDCFLVVADSLFNHELVEVRHMDEKIKLSLTY